MATYTSAITTHASAKQVFDALTRPELVKQWQFGRELTTDWKTGGRISFRTGTGDDVLEQWGTVLEVQDNALIKYNLFTPRPDLADSKENYCVTAYVISDDHGKTRVELIQEDNRPNGFVAQTLERILESLKEVAEAH
ncbi:MAG TPA: SRPBCC family protein [Chitinophaga sp.]